MADQESFGTTLLIVCMDMFGAEFLEWSPLTLVAELETETGVAIPQVNVDKLCESCRLLTTNEFFQSLPDFIRACNVLSNKSMLPETTDPVAEPGEVAWGVTEALLLTPLDPHEADFSSDICKYTGMLLDEFGFLRTPGVLQFAERKEPDVTGVDADLQELTAAVGSERVTEVEQEVKSNLAMLVKQIESLVLARGQTTGIMEAIRKRVQEFAR